MTTLMEQEIELLREQVKHLQEKLEVRSQELNHLRKMYQAAKERVEAGLDSLAEVVENF